MNPQQQSGSMEALPLRRGSHVAVPWLLLGVLLSLASCKAQGQESMGVVATRDARVTGGLEVHGERAELVRNVSVTALDRTAPITLSRGGTVLVCSTSEFHLLRSGGAGALVFGLNRGALEIESEGHTGDVVLTPDLKLAPITPGPLQLALRVTPEGDTCVDNAGLKAPVLLVSDAFSASSYRVLPGQHVLFVKGDLHQVVDHERALCGCPSAVAPQIASLRPGQTMTAAQAAAVHPFPEAQSAGLAPVSSPANQAPVGTASSQVTTSFSYADGEGKPPAQAPGAAVSTGRGLGPKAAQAAPPAAEYSGFGNALRRFFHKLFHPSSAS